jgi:hypothetical protein
MKRKGSFPPVEMNRKDGSFLPVEMAVRRAILPRRSEATKRLPAPPKKNLLFKKPAVGLFHNSSKEN